MAELVEYEQGDPFPGTIGRTVSESSPAWPKPLRAPEGSPNVVFVVLDDVGYGQLSAFGGLVNTPNIDRLADNGLRYTNMHTTAICSPTRACVLTGRNHHSNGVACIMEMATGYPGYDARMPFENGMLPEMLLEHGYNTFCVGKWHLAPLEESSPAGPFHRWPLGRGFERYYGFLGGGTSQWYPDLTEDNHATAPPKSPEDGYHLSEDLADKAIQFVLDAHASAPDKPFFLYFAPGAGHSPHQVAPEWIDKYRGVFDIGWDRYRDIVFARQQELGILGPDAELSPRDPDVPEWDSLPPRERELSARFMEVYAGFVEHADHHLGRILDTLAELGELDNTLVMVVSDNGASSEGGVSGTFNEIGVFNNRWETADEMIPRIAELGGTRSFNNYPWGWSWAGNTPFRRWKKEVYRGGATDPLVVSWPAGIRARGEIRGQFAHAIDMAPTVLDLLGLEPPSAIRGVPQSPLEGVSFGHTVDDPDAPTLHRVQYFEMFGQRAIDSDGWRAVCGWPGSSYADGAAKGRALGGEITPAILDELDAEGWELFHVAADPAECHDLATAHPEKLRELVDLWWAEAAKFKVLPLDGSLFLRLAAERPQLAAGLARHVYYPGMSVVPYAAAPRLLNRPHSIVADVELPAGGAEGVLLAQGGVTGGYVLYVKDGRLHYRHNYLGFEELAVISREVLPAGLVTLRYEFEPTSPPDLAHGRGAGGRAQLYVDGRLVGHAEFPATVPLSFGSGGLTCGYDSGSSVSQDYIPPFRFTGTIRKVTVDLSGELIEDDEAEIARLLATQ